MPFDNETGRAAGLKGGKNRWRDKDPVTVRNKRFLVAVSDSELETMNEKAAAYGLSRIELIVRAVAAYKPQKK